MAMGTLPATESTGLYRSLSRVALFQPVSDFLAPDGLTGTADYGDGVEYARLCASLPTKQVRLLL